MKQYQELENLNQEGFSINHTSSIQLILFFLGALVLFLIKLPFQKLKAKDQATASALSALDTHLTKPTRLSKSQTGSYSESSDESVSELGLRHQ